MCQRPFQYYGYIKDIKSLIVWEVKYNMALLEQLSGTSTSTALMTDQTFPNVTQQNFEITGGFVDGMGGIMMALSAPLITASGREAWEGYSVAHQGWIDESAYLKANYQKHRNPLKGTIQDQDQTVGYRMYCRQMKAAHPRSPPRYGNGRGVKRFPLKETQRIKCLHHCGRAVQRMQIL